MNRSHINDMARVPNSEHPFPESVQVSAVLDISVRQRCYWSAVSAASVIVAVTAGTYIAVGAYVLGLVSILIAATCLLLAVRNLTGVRMASQIVRTDQLPDSPAVRANSFADLSRSRR